ncbi:Rne/Rng family ribonuclease [Methyloligella sp. 2.7D]|uniref:Rne/Rng family ribonuclease n=1 Tax=unclassified Methyloligella TaxID=2625955 RepID=UPI00157CF045|nr:ribonuclease E/G [Methyloligella sp. GL2]QKP77810.1 Rne/Rng family ribonuclease [Methyloligella sp. GL2]
MPSKMLIDAAHPEETRVVVVKGNRVEEFDYESANKKQLRGNIYLAKVTRVEPSLQAAFVDYGGNRHGFLAFNEIHPDYYQIPVADRQALLEEEAEEESRAQAAEDAEDEAVSGKRRSRRRRGRGRGKSEVQEAEAQETEAQDGETPEIEAQDADAQEAEAESAEAAEGKTEKAKPKRARSRSRSKATAPEETEEAAPTEGEEDDTDLALAKSDLNHVITKQAPAPKDSDEDDDEDEESEDARGESSDEDEESSEDAGETRGRKSRGRRTKAKSKDDKESGEESVESVGSEDAMEEVPERPRRRRRSYKIQEVIRRRQIILVQVVKEERGNKGAALTTYLSLAGRYTVLMPNTARGGGISRKITQAPDRKRLREIADDLEVPQGMGLIIRTAGAQRTKSEIKRDYDYLLRLWETVRDLTLKSTAPSLVYEEGSLIKRSIRDLYNKDIDEVLVAGEDAYREAKDFMRMLMPSHAKNVKLYKEPDPLFIHYKVERQLAAMFSPQVTLKSGGYIVINQTEALVAVDVNSGKATREHNIEDTALRTNLEAAEEIARQLRLRDLAGLIVIDFIDMDERRNNRHVEKRLKDSLRNDRARIQVGRISPFGLLEMSRQRLRTGMLEGSTSPCPMCQGTGMVRSVESVALDVLRTLEDKLISEGVTALTATTAPEVALYILNQKRSHLKDIEQRFAVPIMVTASEAMHGATFSIEKMAEAEMATGEGAVVQMDWAHHQPSSSEDGEESGESGRRRSRRRRRRRRGGGGDGDGESISAESSAQDETEDEAVAAVSDSEDGETDDEEQSKRPRRRGRRGGRRGRRGGANRAAEADAASENDVTGETSETSEDSSEETVTPEPAPAPQAEAETEDNTPEPVAVEAKPEEETVEPVLAAHSEETEAVSFEVEEETETRVYAEPETAETETAVAEETTEEPDDDRPRRRGWWQR